MPFEVRLHCLPHEAPADVPGGSGPGGASARRSVEARETLYLGNLTLIIDRLQELFDQWETQGTFPPPITTDVLCRARLAVHEWIANLVQHADFEGRVPEIALSVWVEEAMLCCAVLDNSAGFDLDLYPRMTLEEVHERLPERGMGLLLLHACANRVHYCSFGRRAHRLEFSIS